MKRDIYQDVTNMIVAELEQGAAPWVKPWTGGKRNGLGVMPTNAATGRTYSGINVPILWMAAEAKGYEQPGWMTFKQALDLGGAVRKGEKGTTVVFTKKLTVEDEQAEGDDSTKQISMLLNFTVFNLAQIDGLPETITEPVQALPTDAERHERAEAFIAATEATIRHGGDRACYIPSQDFINMPPFAAFKQAESYYATGLHELGHWSGAESRMNRDLSGRFGTQAYAAEELIAEMTAAFLCAHLGITGELRHAGYIESWLKLLREDKRAIFTAASQASKAADYLRSFAEIEASKEVA